MSGALVWAGAAGQWPTLGFGMQTSALATWLGEHVISAEGWEQFADPTADFWVNQDALP